MKIIEIDKEEYKVILQNPFSNFESTGFFELNKHKVDNIKYLLFNNGKNRFSLVAGIKHGVLKVPFSAPFGCFSSITKRNKLINFHLALEMLEEWTKKENLQKIEFNFPPHFYEPKYLTMFYNALHCSGFLIDNIDVNYEYDLKNFHDDYEMSIDPKARQSLRVAFKEQLSFEKTKDLTLAYKIIRNNRIHKGFPLKLSQAEIEKTSSVIDVDFFIVKNGDTAISSAIIFHITKNILKVIYWGNTSDSDHLKPMNFLSYNIFKYYSKNGYSFIDIGHSTENSVPNHGLCNFKESIGCSSSPKFSLSKIIY